MSMDSSLLASYCAKRVSCFVRALDERSPATRLPVETFAAQIYMRIITIWCSMSAASVFRRPGPRTLQRAPMGSPHTAVLTGTGQRTYVDGDAAPMEHDQLETPCAFGLLAATVALMTRYADPAPDAKVDIDKMRDLLARKIVSNLFFLQHHPSVPPGFSHVMAQARRHWAGITGQPRAACAPDAPVALH